MMIHPDASKRATLDEVLQEPWYLNESVSNLDEVKAEFAKRNLKINQLPAVQVSQHDKVTSRRVYRSGNQFNSDRCNSIYDKIRE
jgi:hypothetical protein